MFDVIRIITSKQQIFSVRSSLVSPIFKKIIVRSSPDRAKIGFSPDPVRSSPDPCSFLPARPPSPSTKAHHWE